jgi:hypothetical protein
MSDVPVVVLGLGGLALLMILGATGIAATKRRVPLVVWVMGPLLVAGASAISAWLAAGGYMGDIAAAEAGNIVPMAAQGLYDSLAVEWAGRWVAALLFGVAAWGAAVGAFLAGPEGKMTPIAAAVTALLSIIGAATIFGYAGYNGIGGMQSVMLAGLVLVGGLGVAVSALKRALYEHAERVASMRFVSGVSLILGVAYGGRAMTMGNRMESFGPEGIAVQASNLSQAIMMWQDVAGPTATLSWIAFAFALLIGFAGFYNELGEVVDRFTLLDVWAAMLIFLVVGGARTLEGWRIDTLQAVANNAPAAAMYNELGTDIPAALLQVGDKTLSSHAERGGFGDVYVYADLDKQDADDEKKWTRVFAWDGAGWYEDDTPVEQVQPNGLRPLIVMGQGDDAQDLVKVVEAAGGKALLLLRAEEVKADVLVPEELVYLTVTFLPLEVATDMDLKAELWSGAGARVVNWGPTTWYGDTEEEDPVTYLDDVFVDTEATGMHVLLGDQGRVKDVVNSCLAAIMQLDESGKKLNMNDKWCKISLAEVEDVRAEAMKVWETPDPEFTKLSFGRPTKAIGELVGRDLIDDRLRRELGAIDYCIGVFRDEGEEVNGRMSINLTFKSDGSVSPELDERSRNDNAMVFRCVRERFKKVKFVFDEEQWPKPEEVEEGEEPEPLDPETIEMTLDVNYPKL